MLRCFYLLGLAAILLAGCNAPPEAQAPPPAQPARATDTAATIQRAQARLNAGRQIAAAAPGDPFALREAFDQFSIGLLLAPADEPLYAELLRHQAAAALLLDAVSAEGQAPQLCAEARVLWPEAPETFTGCGSPAPPPTPPALPRAPVPRPAAPERPQPPRFGVIERRSFDGDAPGGQYNSCIDIQIRGRSGPIGGAVVGINNGEHSYQNQTDANGYTGRCGLGASTWSVVLFWVPPDQAITGATTTVWVSGAAEQRAAVVFQEQ